MQRRSTTRSTPRKRYTVDAFEGVDELRGQLSDSEVVDDPAEHGEVSDEFQEVNDETFNEDEISAEESEASDRGSVDKADAADDVLEEAGSLVGVESDSGEEDPSNSAKPKYEGSKRRSKKSKVESNPSYTRGLPESIYRPLSSRTKELRRLYYFGPDSSDYEPVLNAQLQWSQGSCLPNRTSRHDGSGGFRQSFFLDQNDKANAMQAAASWLQDGAGYEAFNQKQICNVIDDETEQKAFCHQQAQARHDVVMGPVKNQQKYGLVTGNSMKLAEAWKLESQEQLPPNYKNGYILNMGSRIQCVDWASNQPRTDQYLALATLSERTSWDSATDEPTSPAFAARFPEKSSFEIWKLKSTTDGHIDQQFAPYRSLVICTEWGDAKVLKWAPNYLRAASMPGEITPGLLAGIWTDGAIRVLYIDSSFLKGQSTVHLRIKQTAFRAQPPNTVCTCLTWINSKLIAAGCANGCIAVWNLEKCLKSPSANPRPALYSSISTSLILSITSCSPSRPNILVTSSMTGHMTMTDITRTHQPLLSHASTIFSQRSRIAQALLLWHEFSQIVMQVEDNSSLRGASLRRFFRTVGLGKYKSHGTCIAGSPVHPFILTGTASGEVVSLNPIQRILDGKTPIWQQTWFSHEWRKPTEAEAIAAAQQDQREENASRVQDKSRIISNGLTRITEGQKAENVTLVSEPSGKSNDQETLISVTTYEEKTAITAVAWNPNPQVGGWAAAGCADGFLRIEDLAI